MREYECRLLLGGSGSPHDGQESPHSRDGRSL